jgi:peptide chain release factor 2
LKSSLSAWVKPRNIFDVPALEAKIQDLEQLAAQPDFWDDQAKAQEVLQELSDYKASLAQLQEWQTNLEDTDAILELLQADNDQALFEEAQGTVSSSAMSLTSGNCSSCCLAPTTRKGRCWPLTRVLAVPTPRTGPKCC